MAIDYETAMRVVANDVRSTYSWRDTMLYALGLGMGRDPLDPRELPFVYEGRDGPRVMPTLPVVLVPSNTRDLGVDMTRVLHGEQRLALHTPLPASCEILSDTRTLSVIDKGEGRGAIVNVETVGRRANDGTLLFTAIKSLFARGDGGCGAPAAAPLPTHAIPERAPDVEHTIATRLDQAFIYRLSGDYNPLHADPAMAQRAGFDRPILHGLCTYGIAASAVLASRCDHDPSLIRNFDVRFTAPVFPGETILTHMWVDGDTVAFRCSVPERGVIVIDNGHCMIGPAR